MRQHIVTGMIGMVAFVGMLLVPQPERPPVFGKDTVNIEAEFERLVWEFQSSYGVDREEAVEMLEGK